MRYRNIKTGAVIDSSSLITGDSWERIDEEKLETDKLSKAEVEQLLKEKEKENKELKDEIANLKQQISGLQTENGINSQQQDEDEYVEEEIDLADMTNSDLKDFAKEEGIELTAKDKQNKTNLIEAISKAFED